MKPIALCLKVSAVIVVTSLAGPAQAVVHPFTDLAIEGAQEVPAFDGDGLGVMDCVFNERTGSIIWYVDYELDTDSTTLTMAHFHGPAAVGANAGVRIDLNDGTFPKGRTGIFRGGSVVNVSHREEVLGELWYINLHSNVRTGGELRGQLVAGPVTHTFDTNPITGDQETPPVTTDAAGFIDAAYDAESNRLTFGLRWSGLSTSVNGMHFHTAPPGEPGGVVVNFANVGSFPTTTSGSFAGSVVLSEALEAQLLAGNFYVNIHTVMHGGGEIRGQLIPVAVAVPGDINGDGVVNVADVTELGNLVAANTPPSVGMGDINGDETVDEEDVSALGNAIVNGD